MKRRSRLFSIRYKILLFLFVVLFSAVGVLGFVAYRAVSQDKQLFVLDYNLALLESAKSSITLEMKTRLGFLQVLARRVETDGANALARDKTQGFPKWVSQELLGITLVEVGAGGVPRVERHIPNAELIEKLKLDKQVLEKIHTRYPVSKAALPQNGSVRLLNRSLNLSPKSSEPLGVASMIVQAHYLGRFDSKSYFIVADFLQDFLRNVLTRSEVAELFLLSRQGSLISHTQLLPLVEFSRKRFQHPIVKYIKNTRLSKQSLNLEVDDEKYITNYEALGFEDLFLVSQIKHSVAYQSFYDLARNGAISILVVLYAAFLFALLFSKQITRNIQKLKVAAESLGKGDKEVSVEIRSNDELNTVADSFNWMAGRIQELLQETADKARMEKDLETARLVQNTILNIPVQNSSEYETSFLYVPASECGGDLWDIHRQGRYVTAFIADATGHGAAAAIVTTVAKTCFSTLNSVYAEALPLDDLMQRFNQIIYQSCQGQLLMTMCLVRLDLSTGEVSVCNAGHESPQVIRASETNEKKSVEDLFGRGERLGHDPNSQFTCEKYQLEINDTIFFYTDGITEAHSPEGKQWGERALKKVLRETRQRDLEAVKNTVTEKLTAHQSGEKSLDDLTFFLLRWKKKCADIITAKAA